jgi:hypothetical protein
MRNLADKISFLVIFLTIIFLLIYAYFQFYPFQVLKFANTNLDGTGYYEVLTKSVARGELLQYKSEFTKLIDLNGEVSCFFVDGVIFKEPTFRTSNPLGINNTVRAKLIPESLPTGTYRYSCEVFYELPMHRIIRYQFYTDIFQVTNNDCME